MSVKTTKQQFNQDCAFLGKVDFDQDVVLGRNGKVDGDLKVNGKIINNGLRKYTHTIELQAPGQGTAVFTIDLSTNQPIDSITDLITILGNRTFACSGAFLVGSVTPRVIKIEIGTSSATCYFYDHLLSKYTFSQAGVSIVKDYVYSL